MEQQSLVFTVAFSPDGKAILTAGYSGGRLWEAATQKVIGVLESDFLFGSAAFSPDGKTIVMGILGDHRAQLWDAVTRRPLGVTLRHRSIVTAVAFSPDGRNIVTGCEDQTARFWDPELTKGRRLGISNNGVTPHHEGKVRAVAISPDGETLVTGSDDKTARLWDVATGRPIGAPLKHREAVYSVAFSPDGKYVLTGSLDGIARLWEIAPDETVRLPLPEIKHPSREVMGVVAASFRPDGLILATAHSDGGRLWRGSSPRPLGDLPERPKPDHPGATGIVFSRDGRAVLVIQGKESRVWDALTGRPISSPMLLDMNHGRLIAATFWPDDRTITTILKDGTVGLWQASTGQRIRALQGRPNGPVALAVFSPDRKTVMTAAEDKQPVVLCDIPTGRQTALPSIGRGKVTALSVHPDGKVALTGDASGMVRLWDVTTRVVIGEPLRHEGPVTTAAFSPDGRTIVTASADLTTRLWDATTGQPIAPLLENEGPVVELAFSVNGQVIAARTADSVRTFARLNGQAGVKPLGPPLQRRVYDSEWAADDQGVVTLRREGIRSWNVRVMALSPDGRKVLATCEENEARLWRVPSPLPGDPSRLKLWVEVLTARELDAGGGVHELDAKTWSERRERLHQPGGPPLP